MKNPKYIHIVWQDGMVPEVGVNGVQVDEVLAVVIGQVEALDVLAPCAENHETLMHLWEALAAQQRRNRRRLAQGVEGTAAAHTSAD